jgi:serine/threonine protein kinase
VERVSRAQPASGNLTGKKISHYRVLEILGGGGMGVVYKAEDLKLGRRVALKFLPEELGKDEKALERFEREARAASSMDHPNICAIHEFGEHEGQPFLVMPLLEGQTLRDQIAARIVPFATDELLNLAIQITAGLDAAHQKGITHRDIKPANIFITNRDEAKVLDFGLAKLPSPGDPEAPRYQEIPAGWDTNLSLTRTGVALGTAAYMSPEQVRGEKLDKRSDLFSLGLVLYEMATARQAFSGETASVLHQAILQHTPIPPRELNPALSPKLEKIINKALQKDREARYQSASEMRADLLTLKTDLAPSHPLRLKILASAAVFALAIVATVFFLTRHQTPPAQVLPEVKYRQLTINSPDNTVTSGSISRDGKYLAYVDTVGMHVKEIETGAIQIISPPEPLKDEKRSWEIISTAWLPDSIRFLTNVHPATEDQNTWSSRTTSVWIFSRLGEAPRKLRDHAIAWSVSPDGSLISFGTNTGKLGEREIWMMAPDGEQARKLFDTNENSSIAATFWQPNGRHLLFVRTDGSGATILSRDLVGGPAMTVFTPPEAKEQRGDVVWLRDGRLLYQVVDPSSRSTSIQDTCNFWTLKLDTLTGKPIEKPKRLTAWTGFCLSSANVTADGTRLAFLESSGDHGTSYIADLAWGGTRLLNQTHFTLEEADDAITDWTADSKTTIVIHNRGDHYELYKQALKQETPESIVKATPDLLENAVVSPDGKWVILQVWPISGNPSRLVPVMRVPITGGLPEQLFRVREGSLISCSRAASNLCTVAEQSDDRTGMIITAFDPAKGRGHEIARFEIDPNIDTSRYLQGRISPDGTLLVALRGQRGPIEIRSLHGGSMKVIHPKGVDNTLIVSWAADGKGLFVTNGTKEGSELLYMDLRGNTRLLWKSASLGRRCFGVPSPDGRHLAINDMQQSANMWMMENF